MPRFIEPQLCQVAGEPPAGRRLGARDQVRRLSDAAAHRWREAAACLPARAWIGRTSSPPSSRQAPAARRHPRWRGRGPGPHRRARFRRPSGGHRRGEDRRPGLLRLRSAVRRRRRSARGTAARAQDAAEVDPRGQRRRPSAMSIISSARAMRCCSPPAGWTWRVSSPSASTPPTSPGRGETWTKSKCRAGPRGGDRRLDHHGRGLSLADRRRLSRRRACPRRPDRHGFRPRHGRAPHAEAAGAGNGPESLRGQGRAARGGRRPLGEAASWWPRSSTPASPPTAPSARPRSRACGRTSLPAKSRRRPRRRPRRPH